MGNGPEVVLRGITKVIGKASETANGAQARKMRVGRVLSGWYLRARVRPVVSVHHQASRNLRVMSCYVEIVVSPDLGDDVQGAAVAVPWRTDEALRRRLPLLQ